ncbi:MAG: transposase [Bacteroidales bacterium]
MADYFNQYWDEYVKSPKQYITPEQFKAVNAIRVCRTPALGVDVYSCKDCGEVTEVFHSCKNRFCPTCSWEDTVRWADNLKSRMMAIPHRHVVMTLPHELEPLIKSNDKQLLNVLLRVTADTFRDWMGHKYGINPGIISVLHTFGETKSYHPHVHMIVSWGGIHRATGRLKPIKGHFVNYKFLQKKFRCKFEDELVLLFDKERLKQKFPDRTAFLHFIQRINKTDWVLHLEPPMDIPAQVVRYIGRYSKRACLSEYKITKIEGEYIRFRYKDYRSLDENRKPVEKELELHYRDFFPRLLQHVPLRYFRLVRYYGAYSNKSRIPEEYLHHEVEEQEVNEPPAKGKNEGENRLICPSCKKIKRYQYTLFRHRTTGYEKRYRRKLTRHFMGIGRKAA